MQNKKCISYTNALKININCRLLDITVGPFMLRDSVIYFHWDLSVAAWPLFVTALTCSVLDWNAHVLKEGQAL